MVMRSPIVSVLGHVDHGKTSILDRIRQSTVAAGEAGAITQAIGASMIPLRTIKQKAGKLLKTELKIPGLLFIDTPGHAAFSSMRSRGGTLADIAILVIDINEGFKPQTIEALEILKNTKTPFVIAANKIDLIHGYKNHKEFVLEDIKNQNPDTIQKLETKLYKLVGELHEKLQIDSERFDRVDDYTKKIGIIPTSAHLGLGIAEILMIVSGLAQKFLEKNLNINVKGPGKGTVLEVKTEKGLGTTINAILYDGSIKRNDTVVFADLHKPIIGRIKALLIPNELSEMRDDKAKFKPCNEVHAASGVKIIVPLKDEQILSGMPFEVANEENIEEIKKRVQQQINNVLIDTEQEGIIIKAETIGGLEALTNLLKDINIPISKARIGNINKKDIIEAESNYEKNKSLSVILGFNIAEEESTEKVKIITSPVIYKIIENYDLWKQELEKEEERKELENIMKPAKLEILNGCIFRQSNPCIFGVEVLGGEIKPNIPLMNKNSRIGFIKSINIKKDSVGKATKGEQVAIAMPGVTAGRQINEDEILYSDISQDDFRKLKKLSKYLSEKEKEIIKEIVEIKRKDNPVWGV